MRNLKRALSLALASVMLLGMMVIGAGAKGLDDFSDAAEITNKDAVAITSAIGIFDGYETGDFRPERVVTRGEMAVIISKILYGANVDVSQFAGQSTFNDVPAWAEGYVNLCASLGIVAGYGDGKFGTNDTVTTAQAALMLCRAVGYFQNESELGDSWVLAATAKANGLGIYSGLSGLNATEGLNRDNVAGMVFNTLTKVSTVEYNPTFNMYYTTGKDFANGVKFRYDETLGYKSFKLVYMKSDGDAFERPCTVWGTSNIAIGSYLDADGNIRDTFNRIADKDVIVTSVNEMAQEWHGKVTHEAMYRAAGSNVVGDYDWKVYVDGERQAFDASKLDKDQDNWCFLRATTSATSNVTGNGVVTQLFIDPDAGNDGEVIVAVYKLYAAEVRTVRDGVITLTDLENKHPDHKTSDEFASTAFAAGDVVYYTYADDKIQTVTAATKVEGEVTRVRANYQDNEGDNFVVDGKTYNYNKTMNVADHGLTTNNVGNKVVAYLDEFGYCIYVDEASMTYDYAYVLSVGSTNVYGDNTYSGRLLLADGTVVKAELEKSGVGTAKALEGHIVSYSKDSSGVYTLTDRSALGGSKASPDLEIETSVASMKKFDNGNAGFTANNSTVFVIADTNGSTKIDDYSYSVYTGIKNVPDIDGNGKTGSNATFADVAIRGGGTGTSGIAEFVYIQAGDVSGEDGVIFVKADKGAKLNRDTEIGNYYNLTAMENGEKITLNIKQSATSAVETLITNIGGTGMSKAIVALKGYTLNSDDLVTSVRAYSAVNKDGDGVTKGTGTEKYSRGNVTVAGTNWGVASDAVVVRYSWTGSFSSSTASTIIDDNNDEVLLVLDGNTVTGICVIESNDSGANDGVLACVPKAEDPTKPVDPSTPGVTKHAPVLVSTGAANIAQVETVPDDEDAGRNYTVKFKDNDGKGNAAAANETDKISMTFFAPSTFTGAFEATVGYGSNVQNVRNIAPATPASVASGGIVEAVTVDDRTAITLDLELKAGSTVADRADTITIRWNNGSATLPVTYKLDWTDVIFAAAASYETTMTFKQGGATSTYDYKATVSVNGAAAESVGNASGVISSTSSQNEFKVPYNSNVVITLTADTGKVITDAVVKNGTKIVAYSDKDGKISFNTGEIAALDVDVTIGNPKYAIADSDVTIQLDAADSATLSSVGNALSDMGVNNGRDDSTGLIEAQAGVTTTTTSSGIALGGTVKEYHNLDGAYGAAGSGYYVAVWIPVPAEMSDADRALVTQYTLTVGAPGSGVGTSALDVKGAEKGVWFIFDVATKTTTGGVDTFAGKTRTITIEWKDGSANVIGESVFTIDTTGLTFAK